MSRSNLASWKKLQKLATSDGQLKMAELFNKDKNRANSMTVSAAGISLDYSRNRVTKEVLDTLFLLARECEIESLRDAMFCGEKINNSENRAVLHTALRYQGTDNILVDNNNVIPDIKKVLTQIEKFSGSVRSGEYKGATSERITDIVNIGIGGSDLGPKMVTHALCAYNSAPINSHFVSNVDGSDLYATLDRLKAANTLFIICSKTFNTQETIANALSARQWLVEHLGEDAVGRHFVAVSTNKEKVHQFGIDSNNVFEFWDWVGGRYSLWSSVGLSIALGVGYEHFNELLIGADSMDSHFKTAPLEQNIPVILGLIGIWNRNFLGAATHAILAYEQYLSMLARHIQQLDMESNGKNANRHGTQLDIDSGPIIWGEPGTNGQHAFYQLIHQGTSLIPSDIIFGWQPVHRVGNQHELLIANAIAQGEAFMKGKHSDEISELKEYRVYKGNIPSNTITYKKLDPRSLGALIAMYEHKVMVQGGVWDVNSFDQFGVELGKELAQEILAEFTKGTAGNHDSSTRNLINQYLKERKN